MKKVLDIVNLINYWHTKNPLSQHLCHFSSAQPSPNIDLFQPIVE